MGDEETPQRVWSGSPFVLRIPGYSDASRVLRFRARERVNASYRLVVDLLGPAELAPESALGLQASLTIATSATDRHLNGVITACELRAPHRDGRKVLRVVVEPRFATLGASAGWRIFHDLSVLDVVSRVLTEHGVPFQVRATRRYDPRPHRIQRGERDRAFVERVLAEEGLVHWFEQSSEVAAGETLVISDDPSAYMPLAGAASLKHAAAGSDVAIADDKTLLGASLRASLKPDKQVLRRFNHQQTRFEKADATEEPYAWKEIHRVAPRHGVIYEHEHGLEGLTAREGAAADRLDALRRRATIARARTIYPHLAPGVVFRLDDHPEPAVNGDYVVCSVRHQGRAPELEGSAERPYEATVELAPASAVLRPARPRARLAPGLETATVIGPPGETIFTDDHGRIQVRFHWDIETIDHPPITAWLRVAQPWAGAGFGASFTPRVGCEVLVGFIDADPDKPIVVGSVHNAEQPPPWPFPKGRTTSGIVTRSDPRGKGGNRFTFEDRAGDELVSIHSEKTLAISAADDASVRAIGAFSLRVGGDDTVAVGGASSARYGETRDEFVGGALTRRVGGQAQLEIGQDHVIGVGGSAFTRIRGHAHITVEGGRHTAIGGPSQGQADESLSVNGHYSLGSRRTVTLIGGESLLLQCGKSRIQLTPERVLIDSPEIALQTSKGLTLLHEAGGTSSSLVMNGSTVLSGKSVGVSSSEGAGLLLGADAKLQGAAIQLNSGASGGPPKRVEGDDEKGDAVFKVLPDGLPEGTTEVTLIVSTPLGELEERSCAVGGTAKFEGRPGEAFTLQEIRVGGQSLRVHQVVSVKGETDHG